MKKIFYVTHNKKTYSISNNILNQEMTSCEGCVFDFKQRDCIAVKKKCYLEHNTCCGPLNSIFKLIEGTKKRKLSYE